MRAIWGLSFGWSGRRIRRWLGRTVLLQPVVIVVAAALAFTATSLKPLQAENVRLEKMQSILSTIGVNVGRSEAGAKFEEFVKEELALNVDGTVNQDINAFSVDLI